MSATPCYADIIKLRRQLHKTAETAFNEWHTFHLLQEIFRKQDVEIRYIQSQTVAAHRSMIPTECIHPEEDPQIPGMLVTLRLHEKNSTHPCHAAIRCDLDGLPVQESTSSQHLPQKEGFVSPNGCMHACGHDGHMAIATCTFLYFIEHRRELVHTPYHSISLLFQPAEEGCRGAVVIRDSRLLDDIDELWCFHLGMGLPSGTVAPAPSGFLSTEKFNLCFKGRKAHAGHPELGINALQPLCTTIAGTLALADRNLGRYINFSNVRCDGARNIIPDLACCEGELRARDLKELKALKSEFFKELEKTQAIPLPEQHSEPDRLYYSYTVMGAAAPIKQSAELVKKVEKTALSLGLKCRDFDFNASEDASVLIDYVQSRGGRGCYFVIGADIKAPHHSPLFDFDEQSLITGYRLLSVLIGLHI